MSSSKRRKAPADAPGSSYIDPAYLARKRHEHLKLEKRYLDQCGEVEIVDPYDKPVQIQGHSHSEPICAWPDCKTYLTRPEMHALQLKQGG